MPSGQIGQGAHGGAGYTDTSPRLPVTAYSLMDTCQSLCTWSVVTVAGRPAWKLKAVNGRCPEHRELSRGWSLPQIPPGSAPVPAIAAPEADPGG